MSSQWRRQGLGLHHTDLDGGGKLPMTTASLSPNPCRGAYLVQHSTCVVIQQVKEGMITLRSMIQIHWESGTKSARIPWSNWMTKRSHRLWERDCSNDLSAQSLPFNLWGRTSIQKICINFSCLLLSLQASVAWGDNLMGLPSEWRVILQCLAELMCLSS